MKNRNEKIYDWNDGKVFLVFDKSMRDMTDTVNDLMKVKHIDKDEASDYAKELCKAKSYIIAYNPNDINKKIM